MYDVNARALLDILIEDRSFSAASAMHQPKFWVSPAGVVKNAGNSHENSAKTLFPQAAHSGDAFRQLLARGWIRAVIRDGKLYFQGNANRQSVAALEALAADRRLDLWQEGAGGKPPTLIFKANGRNADTERMGYRDRDYSRPGDYTYARIGDSQSAI